jgi:cytosine/adenosine deaminase-related metal-dependent hydrolase
MVVFLARWLVPVATPPVETGAVAVRDGRVVAAGKKRDVLKALGAAAADAEVRDLGDAVVIPGLVNAHTHLELSYLAESRPSTDSYTGWIRDLLAKRAAASPEAARASAAAAAATLADNGIVAVGDVGNEPWHAGVLASSPLYAVAFHEIYGFRASDAESILEAAADRLETIEAEPAFRAAGGRINVALTPHALQTCSGPLLKALAGRAVASREPLSIHLAESADEVALAKDGTGPLADLLKDRGAWDDSFHAPGLSPVEYLDRLGVLTPHTLAVHCVHLDHQDLSKLQARGVTVVTCPRSNAALGVGRAPIPKILTSGIPVALGTDSLASAPDLDMFNEMAALRAEHPALSPAAVLRMATANGAKALGFGKDLGTIEAGKLASLVVVPMVDGDDDPLEFVTSAPSIVTALEKAEWEAVE